jgi:hypothetical protein
VNKYIVKFKKYLDNKDSSDATAPPVSIKAKDLDDNNTTLTIIADKNHLYEPSYSKDGTSLQFKAGAKVASWQRLDVVVNGNYATMWVVGTEPEIEA